MAKSTLWASFKKTLLYRWRFIIAFGLMGLIFTLVIVLMPIATKLGVSEAEMISAVDSHHLDLNTLFSGGFINAPYLLLQKLSIHLFGLTFFAIKLPSIIFGIASGFLIVLLLNRWFTTSVAVIASTLTISTTGFLFTATTGTPIVSYLFFLALILWLGSKILGENNSPLISAALAATFGIVMYIPYMFYLLLIIVIISFIHPHLRFTIKTLPTPQLILSIILFALITAPIIASLVTATATTLQHLALPHNLDLMANLKSSLALFAFKNVENLPILAPIISLPVALIALGSLILTFKNHHTSRNYILLSLLAFSVVGLLLAPDLFPIILLPIAILVADGVQFLMEHWSVVFPNNSYAKFIGMLPIVIFTVFLSYSSVIYHFYGYRSLKEVNMYYANDLELLRQSLASSDIVLITDNQLRRDFYRILEDKLQISVVDTMPDRVENQVVVFQSDVDKVQGDLSLKQIVTSATYDDADRLYIFKK
ncbi:MAG: glycosyltransferase family 39 protein [Candidatus Nomurabacteria bacterium]|jgi:hypothetical protein|nr:glycosyltransferase family 39 protein [Candidatus Nomurabacteria bacterium]